MKRRWVILLPVGLLVAVVAFAAWLRLPPREPEFEGHTLTEWLYNRDPEFLWIPNDVYGHIHDEFADQIEAGEPWPPASGSRNWSMPEDTARRDAMLHFGTNVLPRLVAWMASEPRPLERLRRWVQAHFAIPVFNPGGLSPVERRHVAAFEGFRALGSAAEPALPALSNLLNQPNPDLQLGWALTSIGPKGIAIVTQALTNSDPQVRDTAALSLGLAGSRATSAVPALLSVIDRGQASYQILGALGRIGCDPALAVPVLERHLQQLIRDESNDSFDMTILLLGLCGEKARPAVPLLLQLYDRSDAWRREKIRASLKRIDPAVWAGLPAGPSDDATPTEPSR